MLYNNKKCHHVHIGENSDISNYEMGSGENKTQIERVKLEKDLGVIIDEKLNFREHITQKVNKANRNIGIIFRTFRYIDKEMFLNLYKEMFLNLFFYSSICRNLHTNLVSAVQNYARECPKTCNAPSEMS